MINILNTYLETYPLETLIQSWTYSLLGAHKLKESGNPRPLVASRQLREMESVKLYYAQLEVYHWDYHTAGIYAAGIAFFSYN